MSEEWPSVISPKDQRVVSADGTYVTRLVANEEQTVHPFVFQACLEAGCSVPGQQVAGTPLTHEETVDKLIEAIHGVYAANNPDLLKADNTPRISAIKNRMPAPYSKEQLEEALELTRSDPVGDAIDG